MGPHHVILLSLAFITLLPLSHCAFMDYDALLIVSNHWPMLNWPIFTAASCPTIAGQVTCNGDFVATLTLANKGLNGMIPLEITNMTKLTKLELYNNALTGSIPAEIYKLNLLTRLGLNNNSLTGTIPSSIGSLAVLEDLYLYENDLIGAIPIELGSLVALKNLGLNNNLLTGTIPTELGNLLVLQHLYLDNNKLVGTIPLQISNGTSILKYFVLNCNHLSICEGPPANKSASFTSCSMGQSEVPTYPSDCQQVWTNINCVFNEACEPKDTPAIEPVEPTPVPIEIPIPVTIPIEVPVEKPVVTMPTPVPVLIFYPVPILLPEPIQDSITCTTAPPQPQEFFACVGESWGSNQSVIVSSIIISGPTSINGNLTINTTLTFNGLTAGIIVDGCISLNGSIVELTLSEEDLNTVGSGERTRELLKQTGQNCAPGSLSGIPIKVTVPESCKRVFSSNSSGPSTLSVVFKVDSSKCRLWWIILASVLGGVIILVAIFVLAVTFNDTLKTKVRPFWSRSRESNLTLTKKTTT